MHDQDRHRAGTGESGSASESAGGVGDTEGTPQVRRFEHYEVMLDEAGRPIELGRGAMGITYKALDVNRLQKASGSGGRGIRLPLLVISCGFCVRKTFK